MVRFDFKEERRQHANCFLARYIPLKEDPVSCRKKKILNGTHDIRLEDKKGMETFEFWGFTQYFFWNIKLPGKSVRIPTG
jgi:hypothetical protein